MQIRATHWDRTGVSEGCHHCHTVRWIINNSRLSNRVPRRLRGHGGVNVRRRRQKDLSQDLAERHNWVVSKLFRIMLTVSTGIYWWNSILFKRTHDTWFLFHFTSVSIGVSQICRSCVMTSGGRCDKRNTCPKINHCETNVTQHLVCVSQRYQSHVLKSGERCKKRKSCRKIYTYNFDTTKLYQHYFESC